MNGVRSARRRSGREAAVFHRRRRVTMQDSGVAVPTEVLAGIAVAPVVDLCVDVTIRIIALVLI